MRRPAALVFAALALGARCKGDAPKEPDASAPAPEAHFPPGQRAAAVADGRAVIERHQCTRCHVVDDIPAGPRALHCTSCHEFLKGLEPGGRQYKEIAAKYGEPILERYQRNIWHLRRVPNLTSIGKRLRPDWIASFLREPFDVRPVMTESMIRHRLDDGEIAKVARYFAAVADVPMDAPPPPERPPEARLEAGGALLRDKGCGKCHTFGNVPLGATRAELEAAYDAALLAPNLRFLRDRMRPSVAARWIKSPQSVLPHAGMPPQPVTDDEAAAMVSYAFFADPKLEPREAARLPDVRPADHAVSWEEVKARVLGRVCVHCHMNDYEKDKGPGNKGGLGYAGVGLAMRTYESLVAGSSDRAGGRVSVLTPREGEKYAPIVTALLRRRVEAARDQVPPYADHERAPYPAGWLPGMPLGLPAMTDEEIGLLERWIDDGCPGPTKITGTPGVYDGLLVPDGPVAKNRGCEVRAPAKARPAWATLTEEKGAAAALEPLK